MQAIFVELSVDVLTGRINGLLFQAEDEDAIIKFEPKVDFSGEEAGGRYLDLHEQFQIFVNSKFKKDITYSEFCVLFDQFSDVPRDCRLSRPYRCFPVMGQTGVFIRHIQSLRGSGKS